MFADKYTVPFRLTQQTFEQHGEEEVQSHKRSRTSLWSGKTTWVIMSIQVSVSGSPNCSPLIFSQNFPLPLWCLSSPLQGSDVSRYLASIWLWGITNSASVICLAAEASLHSLMPPYSLGWLFFVLELYGTLLPWNKRKNLWTKQQQHRIFQKIKYNWAV